MNKELKFDIIGFVCLVIGASISLFLNAFFWIGLGLVIIAFGLFLYALHLGNIRFRNEIITINRESNVELITEILNIYKEANKNNQSDKKIFKQYNGGRGNSFHD